MKKLGILILNWNGGGMIIDCLRDLQSVSSEIDIAVIDNKSTDASLENIRSQFPTVRLISLEENYGFAEGYNRGIVEVINEYQFLFFLNNDTRVPKEYLYSLMNFLDSIPDTTGMVALKMVLSDGVTVNNVGLTMHASGLSFARRNEKEPLWFPSGGGGIYRTTMLKELHNQSGEYFDNDFRFYSEDVDLGFRARLNGWGCSLFDSLPITHLHSVSVNKMPSHFAAYHNQRNQVWVIIKNFPSRFLLRKIVIVLLYQCAAILYYLLKGYAGVILRAKLDALKKLQYFFKKRTQIQKDKKMQAFPPIPFSSTSVWKLLRS